MRARLIYTGVVAAVLLFASCANSGSATTDDGEGVPVFRHVTVPSEIADPRERADYLALHWWDNFDFTDTAILSYPDVSEQAFVDYLSILPMATPEEIRKGLYDLTVNSEADSTVFRWFKDKLEHYLWDPNSPMRNEEYYIPVLEAQMVSRRLDELEKKRVATQLRMACTNRPGTTATDVTVTLADGSHRKLSGIRSEYTILFISNPGCPMCAEVIRYIQSSPVLNRMEEETRNGLPRLTVMTVYPDEDIRSWRKYLPGLPARWINGYDKELVMDREKTYDLKAIPSLYLLDENKTVLLKDAPIEVIEEYLIYVIQNG